MFVTALAAASMGVLPPPVKAGPFVERITVKIMTGADDLRKDSNVMLLMYYSGARREGLATKRADEGWAGNTTKTITFTPKYGDLTVADLQQVSLDFKSGRSTGFDDHWLLKNVVVSATVGGREQTVYTFGGTAMFLQYSQHWMSPFFNGYKSDEVVSPGSIWGVFEGNGPRDTDQILIDMEADDGRFWSGRQSGAQMKNAHSPGIRVNCLATERVAVTSIRAFRLGYGNMSRNRFDLSNDSSGNGLQIGRGNGVSMDGIRFYFKDSQGNTRELVSYNGVGARLTGGWWQPVPIKPLARRDGDPIRLFIIEVMSGKDDLRRSPLAPDLSAYYNSKVDISFNFAITPEHPRYGEWLCDSENAKKAIANKGTFYEQDRDEFPDGWEGRFYQYGRFFKEFKVKGDPVFLSSDFVSANVKFRQGRGGNLLPTQNTGGGLIELLRQPDNWDFDGLIISYQAPDGSLRRIYSNFSIGRRMDQEGELWRSTNFDTLKLRKKPF